MGLNTNEHNDDGAVFLSVRISTDAKGRKKAILAKRCTADTPGAKQVFKADGSPAANKDGDNVYRLEFDSLTGRIVKLERHDAEFGDGKKQSYLHVSVHDGSDLYVLSLDRGDRYWSDFLMRLPLVDTSAPVTLAPYQIPEEGSDKYNAGIGIRQNGQKVKRKWNKEDGYDGGPPQATFDEDEQEWKWGKRNKWMEENILAPIAASLQAMPGEVTAPAAPASNDDDDGLPF